METEELVKKICRIVVDIESKQRYLSNVRGFPSRYSEESAVEALEGVRKQLNGLLYTVTFGKQEQYPLLPRELRSWKRWNYAESRQAG